MPRWMAVVLVVTVLLVAGIAAAVTVAWMRLPELVADRAGKAFGRTVKIGTLHLSPGRWIGVELRDVSVANLPDGTRPDMVTVAAIAGEVQLWPLLHGTVVARSVRVENGDILLEKIGQQPNWRNGPKRPQKPDGGRSSFPTLLGVEMQGVITFRTTSGKPLVTKLDGIRIEAVAPDQPARLVGPGSYQGVSIALDATLGSYDQLHDAAVPFPAEIQMTAGDTVLRFLGTMTRPLDVDGADGRLSLVAPTPTVLEKVSGVDPSPAPPLRIEGSFQREDDVWKMQQAKGALGDAALEDGSLQLHEGSSEPKTPDKIDVDLRFGHVDAGRLLAGFGGGRGSGGSGKSDIVPQLAPDPQVTAKLAAAGLTYEKVALTKPQLAFALEPSQIQLEELSFGALGGQVRLSGQIRAEEDGKTSKIAATMAATGLETAALRQALGAGEVPLSGRVEVHAVAESTGATMAAALSASRGSAVATMQGGSVSGRLLGLVSTDVIKLLQRSPSTVPLNCLLAAIDLRGGVATIGMMRLRSTEGTIMARGQIDLLRETLDVVVASEAKTTGALALDVPVRVSGRLQDPSVAPAGATAGQGALTGESISFLAAPIRPYAQRSGCAR